MNNEEIIRKVLGRKERGLEALEITNLINKTLQLKEKEFLNNIKSLIKQYKFNLKLLSKEEKSILKAVIQDLEELKSEVSNNLKNKSINKKIKKKFLGSLNGTHCPVHGIEYPCHICIKECNEVEKTNIGEKDVNKFR